MGGDRRSPLGGCDRAAHDRIGHLVVDIGGMHPPLIPERGAWLSVLRFESPERRGRLVAPPSHSRRAGTGTAAGPWLDAGVAAGPGGVLSG